MQFVISDQLMDLFCTADFYLNPVTQTNKLELLIWTSSFPYSEI